MNQKSDENWCLVCSGSVFGEEVLITGKKAEKLRQQFHKVLKAHVPTKPPVENICKKCDRNLRRLADATGETAEREIEYMRKAYRKTVQEYNAKAELRRQKLRKAAEAFILGNPNKQQSENKVSLYASKWKFQAKSAGATSKISLPDSSGSSSPSWSKPASGETTPIIDLKQNWVKQVEFHMPVDDNSDLNLDEASTLGENPDNAHEHVTFDKHSNEKLNENLNTLNEISVELNGKSDGMKKHTVELDTISDNSTDSPKENVAIRKSNKFHEDSGKLVKKSNEVISGILKENGNNFDANFEILVEKSAKSNGDVCNNDFEKVEEKSDELNGHIDKLNVSAISVPKFSELNKNSVKLSGKSDELNCTSDKLKEKSEKCNESFSVSTINPKTLKDAAIPLEAKVALIETEDGGENNIVIDIGEKTAEDGVAVKGDNVKLNVKDDGGVKEEHLKLDGKDGGVTSSTEGRDVHAAYNDVNTNAADGSSDHSATISVTTGVAGGDAGSTDDKKNEKNDKKDEEKSDGKSADDKSEVKEEKVRSVKDVVKEIEGEDGGGGKSAAVNGTVMKTEKTSAKGGQSDQSKEKSPLIEKESNVKDTGPGVLCCNIL